MSGGVGGGGATPPSTRLRPVAERHVHDQVKFGEAWRVGPAPPGRFRGPHEILRFRGVELSCGQTLPYAARHPPPVGRRLSFAPARWGSGGGGLPPPAMVRAPGPLWSP